jgi:hypothetical protein
LTTTPQEEPDLLGVFLFEDTMKTNSQIYFENLKVGDNVYGYDNGWKVFTISKITPQRIKCGLTQFTREGYPYGGHGAWLTTPWWAASQILTKAIQADPEALGHDYMMTLAATIKAITAAKEGETK